MSGTQDIYGLSFRHALALRCGLEYVGIFSSEGLARAQKNTKWIYVRRDGEPVTPQEFDEAGPFYEGRAFVELSGKYFVVDEDIKILNTDGYDYIFYEEFKQFEDGLALVRKDDKWFFIDRSCNVLNDAKFDNAYPFSNNIALVINDGLRYYIDRSGRELFGKKFKSAFSFADAMAPVFERKRWFIIDTSGKKISRGFYETYGCAEGYAAVKDKDGWCFIDRQGKPITEERFSDAVEYFNEGMGVVTRDGKANFIDIHGSLLLSGWVDDAHCFEGGLATIKIGNLWYFIDKSGKCISAQGFKYAGGFYKSNTAFVELDDNMYYLMDKIGNIISPPFNMPFDWREGVGRLYDYQAEKYYYIDSSFQKVFI